MAIHHSISPLRSAVLVVCISQLLHVQNVYSYNAERSTSSYSVSDTIHKLCVCMKKSDMHVNTSLLIPTNACEFLLVT